MPDLGTILDKQTAIPTPWLQDVNNATYRTVQRVYGTGVAATDVAAIQAAINAAPDYGIVELVGTFATNATLTVKPKLTIRGVKAKINHSVQATLFKLDVADGFPGQINFQGLRLTGPGAPASGEALGTLTWANVWAAIQIETNAPYITVSDCYIEGWFAGVVLRDAYCSQIGGAYYNNRHGIMLYGACHSAVLDNPLVEGLGGALATGVYVTGLSVNYGAPAGKTALVQSICTRSGAYQGVDVGIWAENSQGFCNAGRIYFETNRQADMILGTYDANASRRANFNQINGANIASPCAFPLPSGVTKARANGCNIQVHNSIGTQMRGLGHYPGSGAPTTRAILFVDGNCGPTEYHWDALTEGTNLFDLSELPGGAYRTKIGKPGGREVAPQFYQNANQFGPALGPQVEGAYFAAEQGGRAMLSLGKPLVDNSDVFFGPRKTLAGSRAGLGYWNAAEEFIRTFIANPDQERLETLWGVIGASAKAVWGQLNAFPTIASAATVAPVEAISFVSGTTAIVNITLPTGFPNGGRLTLIPTGTWTTTAAGNIDRAVTATVGQPIDFIWNGAASKWIVKT